MYANHIFTTEEIVNCHMQKLKGLQNLPNKKETTNENPNPLFVAERQNDRLDWLAIAMRIRSANILEIIPLICSRSPLRSV